MSAAAHRSLVKPLEASSRAAAAVGPNAAMPAASSRSTSPATSGASGPTTTKSIFSRRARTRRCRRCRSRRWRRIPPLARCRGCRARHRACRTRARRRAPRPARARARPIRSTESASQFSLRPRGSCIIAGDDGNPSRRRARDPLQPAGTYRQRTVAGVEAQHRAEFFLCPGARRNLRPEAPFLGPCLSHA